MRPVLLFFVLVLFLECQLPVFKDTCTAGEAGNDTVFITIGTGPVTGVYYPTGRAICSRVNSPRFLCSVERTTGSIYNLKAVEAGVIEFGISQSDHLSSAFLGQGGFRTPLSKLRKVADLFQETICVVVRRDSAIHELFAIRGKRVSTGVEGSGGHASARMLLRLLGWGKGGVREVDSVSNAKALSMLCKGELDAVIFVSAHPYAPLSEASTQCMLRLLDIGRDVSSKFLSKGSPYTEATIPAGTYKGIDRPVRTISVWATMVASSEVSEETVYQVTRAMFEAGQKSPFLPSQSQASVYRTIRHDDTGGVPFHKGALRYYTERGFLKPGLSGRLLLKPD